MGTNRQDEVSRHHRAQRIFTAAADLADDRRARYLSEACGDDEELREEIEAMLAFETEDADFLQPPRRLDATPSPEQIDRYRIVDRIGEGGMGTVYRAEQIEPIRRMVALMVVKAGTNSDRVVTRFENERQALAVMDHPNIARIFDGGVTRDGLPYFVMELVDGQPVTEFCRSEQLSVRDRVALFSDICSAVQHAHQKGIIHRDLKPSNVLVSRRDGAAVVKVIGDPDNPALSREAGGECRP